MASIDTNVGNTDPNIVAEVVDDVQQQVTEDNVVTPEKISQAVEEKAKADGWMELEDWVKAGNDPLTHRDARTFLDRGELFGVIHNTKRELTQTKQALSALQQHYEKVEQVAFKKAIDQLKNERRLALREQDMERVEVIEDAITEREQEFKQDAAIRQAELRKTEQAAPTPQFQAFINRNDWFTKDIRMQRYALTAGNDFVTVNPGVAPEKVFEFIEQEVRETFPEKFKRQVRVSPVDGGSKEPASRGNGKGPSETSLNATQRDVMKRLVASKIITKEKYLQDLRDIGEI